jgi:hypothetical protein
MIHCKQECKQKDEWEKLPYTGLRSLGLETSASESLISAPDVRESSGGE